MIKLEYPVQNLRWGPNNLNFETWEEYWKTLGYLSNPNIHRQNNISANIDIMYERNSLTNSYSDTTRIYYYGDEEEFSNQFPSLYSIHRPNRGNETFRINRKEFGETLIYDLGFEIQDSGGKDGVILPPEENQILRRIRNHQQFNIQAWREGYDLGNL